MGHRQRPSYTRSLLPEFEAQEQPDSSPSTRKNQLDPPRLEQGLEPDEKGSRNLAWKPKLSQNSVPKINSINQIVEMTPALPPLRAETNVNTSNIVQGKQVEASVTPSQPSRKRKMVSGNDPDQVFEPPGDISHCASHLAMGHGHQPSIPISEAQLIGEAELQLDLPRTHASQMSTSRMGQRQQSSARKYPLPELEAHVQPHSSPSTIKNQLDPPRLEQGQVPAEKGSRHFVWMPHLSQMPATRSRSLDQPFLGNGLRRAISISEAQETREAEHFHASQMSASREAEQQRSLVVGNDKEIEKLQGNLQTMKAELKEVEKSQFAQKFWFEKLKHISSEMNAVLDEWNTPTTKLKVQNEENVQKQQERRKERDLIAQAKRADLKMAYQTSASRASSTQSNTEGLAVYEDNVQNFINVNEDPYTICKPDNEELRNSAVGSLAPEERQVEALVNPLPPSSAIPHSEQPGEIPDKYFEQPAGGAEDQQFLEDLQWVDGLLEDHDPLVNLQEDLEDDQKQ